MIRNFLRKTIHTLLSAFLIVNTALAQSDDLPLNPDETVLLNLEFESTEELKEKFSKNYEIQVKFDNSKLKYKKFNYKGSFKKSSLKMDKSEGLRKISYNPENDYKKPKKAEPESLEFVFEVKNDAPACETVIESKFVNFDTSEEEPIISKIVKLAGNPDLDKCKIQSLTSEAGKLIPEFNPEIFEYEMNVEEDIKEVTFNIDPMIEDLKVKVNRKKLRRAGESTDITITVSNPKLKIKNIYNIKVHRNKITKENSTNNSKVNPVSTSKNDNVKTKSNNRSKSSKIKSKSKSISKSHDNSSEKLSKPKSCDKNEITENKPPEVKEDKLDNLEATPESENVVTISVNDNQDIKTYIAIAFLVTSAGIAIYWSIKIILSKKKTEKIN